MTYTEESRGNSRMTYTEDSRCNSKLLTQMREDVIAYILHTTYHHEERAPTNPVSFLLFHMLLS